MDEARFVEFVIHLSDMRKAAKHLSLNREGFNETDSVDLLVSSIAATFRSIGTETEMPVTGKRPGAVRLPLKLSPRIVDVAKSYNKRELTLRFGERTMRMGSLKLDNPDITLGTLPDLKFDLPSDAGPLDTLAMASLLSPEGIADQGLRERVENVAETSPSGSFERCSEPRAVWDLAATDSRAC